MAAGTNTPANAGKKNGGKKNDGKAGSGGKGHGWYVVLLAVVAGVLGFLFGIQYEYERNAVSPVAPPNVGPPRDRPVRPAPARFPADSSLPECKELVACGPVDPATFSPGRDLVRIDDPRVWFESDHGSNQEEDDHTVHRCLEEPLLRLVELAAQRGASLKVHDSYRPTGLHRSNSLHREGRAIDLTSDGLSLEELAKLCWQAGFDWVFYESTVKTGAHIHVSARGSRAPVRAGGVATNAVAREVPD